MATITLEIESRSEPFRRVRLAAPGATTLEGLARWLEGEFGLDARRAHSFFRSGVPWDERSEYSSHGHSPLPMQGVRLDRLALRPGAYVLHLHDYENPRWHEIRVASVSADEAPLEVLERKDLGAEAPLASRVCAAIEGPSAHDDSPEVLHAALRVAEELLAQGPAEIERIAERLGLAAGRWLEDLPLELSHAGLVEEATRLCERLALVLERPEHLGVRAVILARAGRADEARRQVAEMLERFPADARVVLRAGDAELRLGNVERAEELYRLALPLAEDPEAARDARERLVGLLLEAGRGEEARALELLAEGEEEEDDAELVPAPRVGRNDPCPCGSGKKYKKCCARAEAEPLEVELLSQAVERAVDHLIHSEHGASARSGIGAFAGPTFAELDLGEALPLLPSEEAELLYLDWWMLDREHASGTSLLDLYLAKRRSKLDPRAVRLLERWRRTTLSLLQVERFDPRAPKPTLEASELLTGERHELPLVATVFLPDGVEHVLARVIELDGRATLMHAIPLEKALVEPLLRSARARGVEAVEPRARAPLLFQAWLDALHAGV